jgi:rhodanese-related sulfurtransferase
MSEDLPSLPDPQYTMEVSVDFVAQWHHLPLEKRPRLIDCRERDELEICRIEGCEWVPLGTFPVSLEKLTADTTRGMVVYCHHGMRSMNATAFLRAHGVENAFSMRGGIDVWSAEIDSEVARY